MLLEIELHQAFERVCSYVFSSIFLPWATLSVSLWTESILRIASLIGRDFYEHSLLHEMEEESGFWYECFAGEAHARVCTRLRTCACVGAWDRLEWRISPVTVLWELVGADVWLSMCFEWKRERERRASINSTCLCAVLSAEERRKLLYNSR